jgi:uroporphyrinogen-III synthase
MSKPILILRPEPGNGETAARVVTLGLEPLSYPLFTIHALDWVAPDPASYSGLLLTSANAVREAGPQLALYAHLPVFAVGSATAKAAQEAGFANITIGKGGVDAVLAQIGSGHLLHLCGQDVTEAAPTDVRLDRIAVYASDEGEAEALFDYLRAQPVILLHSARAASRLAMLVTDRSSVPIAALSESVALAADKGWKSIAIAAQPNDEALLIAAKTLT